MTSTQSMPPGGDASASSVPAIRSITFDDVVDALMAGIRDFQAEPVHGLGLGAIYAVGGWILLLLLYALDLPYLVYPLTAGFALVAPFVATGFYEISRRLEAGESVTWGAVRDSIRDCCRRDLGWMALVTVFTLIIWVDFAVFLYLMFFGIKSLGTYELVHLVFTTAKGAAFFAVGNLFGAFFALVAFSLTVVSFPLLFDRDVDFVTAMITSVKSVIRNPVPMIGWAVVIALALVVSFVTLFVGLFVTLPILGFSTWHLFRRLIEPEVVQS